MIRFIIIIALFFTMLALSPLLIDEKGYILIAMGETIIELTVLSAAILFVLFSLCAYVIYKFIRGGFKISFNAWHTLAFASRKRGIANFNKGLAAYMLEDYQDAEQLFAKSAEPAKRQQSAYLLAAASAAKQDLSDNTNHYLALLAQESTKAQGSDIIRIIVNIKLLMNQTNTEAYEKARVLLDENHKQIGHEPRLLSLEIDLCLIEKRYEATVNWLASARKEKSVNKTTLQIWEEKAYYGLFNELIITQDQASLHAYWNTLSRKIKHSDTVLFAYCKVLAEQNIIDPLTNLIAPALKKQPKAHFIKRLRTLPIKQSEPLIAIVQKHLYNDKHNAMWLSCLGHLAIMNEHWSMAEKALRSLVNLEANQHERQYDKQDLHAFAKALAAEGQHQAANEVWQKINSLFY